MPPSDKQCPSLIVALDEPVKPRKPEKLIRNLVLIEAVPYLTILPISDSMRAALHGLLLFIVCGSSLPALWRSRFLRSGYGVLLAWMALEALRAPSPARAIEKLAPTILLLAGISVAVSRIRTRKDIGYALREFLSGCQILVWLNLLAIPLNHSWVIDPETDVVRFVGFMPGPNFVGNLMLVTVGVGLILKPSRWEYLTLVAAIADGLLSDSRTPFVALIAGVVVWLASMQGARGKWAAALILAAALALSVSHNSYLTRGAAGGNGRTALWSYELGKITDSPLIGYGYGIERTWLSEQKDFTDWHWQNPDSFQSGYLSLAMQLGTPALCLWLWLFLRPWWGVCQDSNNRLLKTIFCLVIVPVLVYALSESTGWEARDVDGLLIFLVWMTAEKYRWSVLVERRVRKVEPTASGAVDYARILSEQPYRRAGGSP